MSETKSLSKFNPNPAKPEISSTKIIVLIHFSAIFAVVLLLIYALQRNDASKYLDSNYFSEVHLKLKGSEFSIFGRKLTLGEGDFFLSIPYAEPTRRFEHSRLGQLPNNFYAIHHNEGCPNGFTRTKAYPGFNWDPPPLEKVVVPEQCQTLNIYRCMDKQKPGENQLLPVLVYVNEGEWMKRSNANLEPSNIIRTVACNPNGGMLVVSVNYRMGPFGFSNIPTSDSDQEGNFALGDIRIALEWVRENIGHFGGNRDKVTVIARGVGAQIVSVLGLQADTEKLFKRQILISGSAFAPSLYQTNSFANLNDPNGAENDATFHFSKAANCVNEQDWKVMTGEHPDVSGNRSMVRGKLVACLQGLPVEAIEQVESHVRSSTFIRWPLIKDPRPSQIPLLSHFLPENPLAHISSIPTIIGICNAKKFDNIKLKPNNPKMAPEIRKRINDAIWEEVREKLSMIGDLRQLNYSGPVIDHYMDIMHELSRNDSISLEEMVEQFIETVQFDFVSNGPLFLEALQRSQVANSRVFFFNFEAAANLTVRRLDVSEAGAESKNEVAGPQLACIDDIVLNPLLFENAQLSQLKKLFTNFITNFVHYGDPNSDEFDSAHEELKSSVEWPNLFPRQKKQNTDKSIQRPLPALNKSKVLSVKPDGKATIQSYESIYRRNGAFWSCEMAKHLGLVSFCN